MKVFKVSHYETMSQEACKRIIRYVQGNASPVLGLATGATPERLYELLIKAHQRDEVSFSKAISFNLDEYVGLNRDHPNSYFTYMHNKLFNHIDLPEEQIHIPDGTARDLLGECEHYDKQISEAGGIGLQILGLGMNGHIGFNEPGSSFNEHTHVVRLAESTRKANAQYFHGIADVPTEAITMGIKTIMESKEIILLVSGIQKAEPLKRLITGPISEEFPASILQTHPNVTILADTEATSLL
ncbi:MAG: glucosamine-6-phosphate deaminase [Bacillus sp. (in: Bacteria)]|nr:glucosamine-6-phosphate deaminase [Bacillus sp. (in: firmicutes)]